MNSSSGQNNNDQHQDKVSASARRSGEVSKQQVQQAPKKVSIATKQQQQLLTSSNAQQEQQQTPIVQTKPLFYDNISIDLSDKERLEQLMDAIVEYEKRKVMENFMPRTLQRKIVCCFLAENN